MPLDLNNGYQDAQDKLKSYKTFRESISAIKKAQQVTSNQNQPPLNLSNNQLDTSQAQQKIKQQVQTQFDQLIGLIFANKGAGPQSVQYLIKKFVKAIKSMQPRLEKILIEEIIKALGCDLEQTYDGNTSFYVKVQSIDLFKILMLDPTSKKGKSFYEKVDFNTGTSTNVPRSTNKMFYNLIKTPTPLSTQISNDYLGLSTNPLFDIQYVNQNTLTGEVGDWYFVTLKSRPDGAPNKISQFLNDYFKTITLIDLKTVVAMLLEAIFGMFSITIGSGTATIDDKSKFGLIIQRILGLCFDEDSEISVAGQAKTPELDDTTDTFFDITNIEKGIIEQRTEQIKKGIVTFESCENIELPVNPDYLLDILETINENGSNLEQSLDNISNALVNDPKWQFALSINYPNNIKFEINNSFVKNLPLSVISSVLSPKVIFPFISMIKALGIEYDETKAGLTNFIKENKTFMRNIASRIGAIFIETLFNEIKKDIRNLVRSIIADITHDSQAVTYIMIERLVNIAITVSNIINDYRKCKSVIDSILSLFNLVPRLNQSIIPPALIPLCSFLPGSSADRQFINSIENMQKSGLPTGPNADGTPNLGLQAIYAQLKGSDRENKENGTLAAQVRLPIPPYIFKVDGKSV